MDDKERELHQLELELAFKKGQLKHDKELLEIIKRLIADGDAKTEQKIMDFLRKQHGG